MHYLTRGFTFSASHRLQQPELSAEENHRAFGLCENIHGHNYRLEVTICGNIDPLRGFCCNVLDLKAIVDRLITDPCEHQFLNELPLFADVCPTTMENLALRMWQVLEPALQEQGMRLYEVMLAETPDNLVRLRQTERPG